MPEGATRNSGWKMVAFGSVVRLSTERSGNPESDGFDRFVGLEHLDPGDLRVRRWGDIADGTTFTSVFRPGQVLFGKRRAYQRKVGVPDFSGVCSGDIYVLEPKGNALLPELLPFICQTDAFFEHAVGTSAGSLSPRTNWKSLASFEFALPPIEAQRRIAGLLGQCQKLGDRLVDLKDRTHSVLESHRDQIFTKSKPRRRSLEEIASVRYGLGQPPKSAIKGVAMIRATNINRGRIVADDLMRVDIDAIPESRRILLKEGEILIVRSGAYTGDSALITAEWAGSIAGYDLVISPDPDKIYPSFLAHFLLARRTVESVLRSMSGRTAQPHLNVQDVAGIQVPCPDIAAQVEAAALMNRLQAYMESIESRLGDLKRLKAHLNTSLRGFISS